MWMGCGRGAVTAAVGGYRVRSAGCTLAAAAATASSLPSDGRRDTDEAAVLLQVDVQWRDEERSGPPPPPGPFHEEVWDVGALEGASMDGTRLWSEASVSSRGAARPPPPLPRRTTGVNRSRRKSSRSEWSASELARLPLRLVAVAAALR